MSQQLQSQRNISMKSNQETLKLQEIIKKDLQSLGKNQNSRLSLQDMCQFLDKKSQDIFDRSLATQIFQNIDQNQDGFITLDELAKGYAENGDKLQDSIIQLQQQIQLYNDKKREAEQRLLENKSKLKSESKLTVTIMKARGLMPVQGGKSSYYCKVECENQTFKTQSVGNTQDPEWQESFSFEIKKGQDNLKIAITDEWAQSRNSFQESVQISLSDLKDQLKHEQ